MDFRCMYHTFNHSSRCGVRKRMRRLPVLLPEQVAVVLEQFAYQQEGVYGGDTVGDEARYPFALGAVLAGHEELVPERAELLVVVLQLGSELLLAGLYLVQRVILLFRRDDG